MSAPQPNRPNFDRIARPYRWIEYLSFGGALERCRLHFLPQLDKKKSALVLGDGDGRFIARLLALNQGLHADAVDLSAAMLKLLRGRCDAEAPNLASQLSCHRMDALAFAENIGRERQYDLIVTHFFLDCLDQRHTDALARALARTAAPGAVWIISDFRIPAGAMKVPAWIIVRGLYLAFQVLAGLETRRLPDHAAALCEAGFSRESAQCFLGGLLFTERWSLKE